MSLRLFPAFLASAFTAVLASGASAQTGSWSAAKQADLDNYIPRVMGLEGVPGLAIAVVLNNQVVYSKGFGVKRIGSSAPVQPSTQFRLASTGKQLATTLMAAVVDTGAVAWTTPARLVLPGLQLSSAAQTQRVTYSDLVCNCLGAERRDLDLVFNGIPTTTASAFAGLKNLAFTEPAGTFAYSNQLVAAGGWAGAVAGGGSAADLGTAFSSQLRQRVLNPIGMSRTTVSEAEVVAGGDYAAPHAWTLQGTRELIDPLVDRWVDDYAAAGAVWSTVGDMANYLVMQMNRGLALNGARVVSTQNLEKLWAPQVNVAPGVDYGLGLFVSSYRGKRVLYHGGNLAGSTSQAFFMPEDGVGLVVLSNAESSLVPDILLNRVLNSVFDQPQYSEAAIVNAISSTRAAYVTALAQSETIDAGLAATYLGTYADPKGGNLTVTYRNGRFAFDFGELTLPMLRYVDRAADPLGTGPFVVLAEKGPFAGLGFLPSVGPGGRAQIVLPFSPTVSYTFIKP